MAENIKKTYILLGITALILAILACGSVRVGVVTPSPEGELQPESQGSEQESELAALEAVETQTEVEIIIEPDDLTIKSPNTVPVTAWLGHIASLPQSSQFDDILVLSPEGTGELGLAGATPEIEAEIRALRDVEGPHEWVHVWGDLSCRVEDYNNCQILVNQLQYGANYSEEEVGDWIGTIKRYTFNGGDATIFELPGDFPMWYSIHASQDPNLQAQIKQLRDTGALVKVSGQLLVGIPDVNGTRIEVSNLEVIEPGKQKTPVYEPDFEVSTDWPVFVNDRYGYQIKYPMDATISLFGPATFPAEDLPDDLTTDQYMDSLLKEYSDRLCVSIKYSLGWVNISAPPNQEKYMNPCGPTGVGSGVVIPMI